MIGFPLRRLALTGALTAIALAAAAGSAQAAVTASTISSPAANSYFFYDTNAASSTLFTVSGTTTGTGNVDVNCYDGNTNVRTLVSIAVTGNAFSVPVTTAEIASSGLHNGTCVLRAVDTGDPTDFSPGSTTSFAGPAIAVTEKNAPTAVAGIQNFNYYLNGFSGFMQIESAGACGLEYGYLLAPVTFEQSSNGSFACLGALFDIYHSQASTTVGPEIAVDGAEALDAERASASTPGFQGIALTESFSGGNLTVHDNEPLMYCTPTCSSTTSYTSSGVELDRTWQTGADGLIVSQTDVFRSVDGRQHSIAVLEDDEINTTSPPGAAFNFPGSSGFQDYSDTATLTLPSGPGVIYYKTDSATPDGGDGTNPQGAILYASTTTSPVAFTYSDIGGSGNTPEWVMPYTRTVPAGGSAALRFAYIQAFSLSQVQTLAQAALASFSPSVSIASPATGSTLTSSPVTVTGTASDAVAITSVKVNGVAATLGAGGAFSAAVALTPGANTITAVATDSDGITSQQQITVTYKNPPAVITGAPPAVITGAASAVKATSVKIAGTVNPEGQATTYLVQFGTTTMYGSAATTTSTGAGTTPVTATSTLTALKANTLYHYRLTATNASGTSYGADGTFHTAKPSPTGLGAKASPKTAATFPYHYRVKGKLTLPKGITTKLGCSGRITIKVTRGKKTIATIRTTITKKCTWKASVTLKNHAKVPGHGKLHLTPRFGGNKVLASLTARPLTVKYG
jgi:hypothetical protein